MSTISLSKEVSISRTIHYCWFGESPLPETAQKCIESWEKFFPDYEIKEWNESNFDVNCCAYIQEAYQEKKWAFVSDYARFWILYHYGGLYFDTDVEVIKDMRDILEKGAFMGCETIGKCNPGLGLYASSGMGLYKEILDFYETIHFIQTDGTLCLETVVKYVSDILNRYGFADCNTLQKICGNDWQIFVYPPEYFCPLNYFTGKLTITDNTRSIHHYTATWQNEKYKRQAYVLKCLNETFGEKVGYKIWRAYTLPSRIQNKIATLGILGTVSFALKKVKRWK